MRKLIFCNLVTVDGFFEGPGGDISWHYNDDEHTEYARKILSQVDTLIFGKRTYELMADFWPSPAAWAEPISQRMNELNKVVFSRTLERADWQNTRLVRGDAAEEMRQLKKQAGKDMAILGSAKLGSSLINSGLVDEYQLLVNPILLGRGRPLFEGLHEKHRLKLSRNHVRKNGVVELYYHNT